MWMEVDGVPRRFLIVTGCTRCMAHASCCRKWRKQRIDVTTVSGEQLRCVGVGSVKLQAPEGRWVTVEDFIATYDPASRSWTTAWKWVNGKAPEIVCNSREEYPPAAEVRTSYAKELDLWIRNGWLIPYDEKRVGPAKALIPLMGVTQHNKGKVRPVVDFRELNSYIDVFTAKSEVCAHKLREWRRQGENVSIVDLRKAYLQLHVDETLWPFQTVMIRGRRGENGALVWSRGNEIKELPIPLTRRTVFGYCGRIVGHYPVCDWLRPAAAFIKREVNLVTSTWDDEIHDKRILEHVRELAAMVTAHDPVRGKWAVSGNKAKVWVDASTLAIGIVVEVNGAIIEDASQLRPDDCHHINLAELDAVIRGLNVAHSWQLQDIELMTDSATVYRWLDEGLSGRSSLKAKAASEMLIRILSGISLGPYHFAGPLRLSRPPLPLWGPLGVPWRTLGITGLIEALIILNMLVATNTYGRTI
uniref:RNase H domain-containing protein n=1 Tax=Trichuris muris TaxID=70415 RepID=A0A5S6QBQ6_TRIMR